MAQTAAIANMYISNNATWQDAFQFGVTGDTSWNFNGMAFTCQVKASRNDAAALLGAQSSDGTIVIDDPIQRILHFNVPDTLIVEKLPCATYVYDLVMQDTSNPPIRTLLMQGFLTVRQGITED